MSDKIACNKATSKTERSSLLFSTMYKLSTERYGVAKKEEGKEKREKKEKKKARDKNGNG